MEVGKIGLRLHNTMTQQKEVLIPICGITAYKFSHIGHARAAVAFDVLYRFSSSILKALGYQVTYVRNFTDVDDKTLQDLVEALSPYQEAFKNDIGKAEQTSEAKDMIKKVKSEFEAKISDDLNTSPILTAAFQDAMEFINVSITKLKRMQKRQQMSLVVSLLEVEKVVRAVLDLLGLLSTLSYAEFLKGMKQKALAKAKMGEEKILQKIEERKIARKNKDFERSDEIRNTLALAGISLMDIPEKDTMLRPCIPQSQSDSAKVDATQQSTPP